MPDSIVASYPVVPFGDDSVVIAGEAGENEAVSSSHDYRELRNKFLASHSASRISLREDRVFDAVRKFTRCSYWILHGFAHSKLFTAVTTALTIYALLGDDMRLLFTDKPADFAFDCMTVTCIVVFAFESLAMSIALDGYFLSFLFFLDIFATATLVLDITFVAELCFGDVLSKEYDAGDSSGSMQVDAMKSARMSRVGSKASRVVRLARLMRLIRLWKFFDCYNKKAKTAIRGSLLPGVGVVACDDESLMVGVSESDVSKKLSEMTTRRVIMLVLSIVLMLPFFEPDVYMDSLPSSAQYGVDRLYRRFREDMVKYDPMAGEAQRQTYLGSLDRENYVSDFLLYTYFHNWFCGDSPSGKANSPVSSFGKLFWVGGRPAAAAEADFFLPGSSNSSSVDWNNDWGGKDWALYLGDLPPKAQDALRMPWKDTLECLDGHIQGISLIESASPRAKCPRDLRFQERAIVFPMVMSMQESKNHFVFMFVFDRRSGSQTEAALNAGLTFFMCLLLGVGAMTFSIDANELVVIPLERMATKLAKIKANPVFAKSIGEEMIIQGKRSIGSHMGESQSRASCCRGCCDRLPAWLTKCRCWGRDPKSAPEPMETEVLEKTIIKIGSMLALGFGEAGTEMIKRSLGEAWHLLGSDDTDTNFKTCGTKVDAIFGYCSIRDFMDVAEVLENQVMVFVNRIAAIVHYSVYEFLGSADQSIGDAFLLVWRLSGHDRQGQQRLADCAAISLVKIVASLRKSVVLAEYSRHQELVKILPEYRVRMGFGLHTGWAIEGAIGSKFKVDASYLSPHVGIASRLQTLSKMYGTHFVISEMLVDLLTEPVSDLCRQIDCMALADAKPFKLFTLDLDDLAVHVDPDTNCRSHSKREKVRERRARQNRRNNRFGDTFSMEQLVNDDEDIQLMRSEYSAEFMLKFREGFFYYESGHWDAALAKLEETCFMLTVEDGPSAALLRFMKRYANQAPSDWPGYRVYPKS